jgi:hypothetical protein
MATTPAWSEGNCLVPAALDGQRLQSPGLELDGKISLVLEAEQAEQAGDDDQAVEDQHEAQAGGCGVHGDP